MNNADYRFFVPIPPREGGVDSDHHPRSGTLAMSSATHLLPDPETSPPKSPRRARLERPDGLDRVTKFPEPRVKKIRGAKLVGIWIGLAAAAWMVAVGVGYGFFVVARTVL